MAKYLRKYNKNTQSWEIITTNSASDVYVSNPHFVENETPITLENTLTNISNSINKLQRNVSWLAEHGGGNGIGGNGVGNSSTYGVMILNSGIKDGTLFVQESSCKIIFKFTGGTVTDTIQYRIMLDGNVLITSAQAMVNNNISVEINNLEKFSSTSPHNFLIEGVDKDGMSIPPYILYIVESSITLSCAKENILRIDGDGVIDITVINKLINTDTTISIENKQNGRKYSHTYNSTTSVATTIPIKFFGNLVNTQDMNVGGLYNIEIFGQANTKDGTAITASPITSRVIIQDSANIVLSVNGLAEDGGDEVPIYYLGENVVYNMKCYLQDVSLFYYAIRYKMIDPNTSEEKTMEGIEDVGVYDLEGQSYTVNPQMGVGTIVQQNIYLGLTKNDYIGQWKVYIKCWAQGGAISSETIYRFDIQPNNKGIFPKQIPHLSIDGIGSTLLAFWDESNFPANTQQAQTWTSTVEDYASPFWTVGSDLAEVTNTMEIYNVNNEVNGFIKTPYNEKYLRLYNTAYAIAKLNLNLLLNDKSEFKDDAFKYGFTISLCFKSDIHPSNDNVVMQWGELGSDNELLDGILVTVDTVLWKFKSGDNSVTENKTLKVNIQQNVLTMVDFVYEVHKKEVNGRYSYVGNAKIFINGVLNAATEVKYYKSNFYRNIYLACKYKSNNFSNFSDVDILSLNIFTHFLNDLDVVVNSFNLLCGKDENGGIDIEKYVKWKKNNFLDSLNETPKCAIYDGGYNSISFDEIIKKDIPIPILFLSTTEITMSEFEETGQNIPTNTYKATMRYYDPSNKKTVESDAVAFEIQGTSTTTSGVKNIELYFTDIIYSNGTNELQLFQPKEDWFPESQFTIKADIVDSAHVNNAFIGKWINESNLLNNTPPMDFVENNPPKDKVLLSDGSENIIKHTKIPKVKHTTEGFPILLMIQFRGQDTPKLYGIFSFNLGRYSYFNLGLKILKNFTRREVINDVIHEHSTPALINYYEYYKQDESTDGTGTNIKMSDVYSFEFLSSADENNNDYPTWSQDDESIIKHIGEFKYNGKTGNNTQPASDDDVWKQLRKIFTATAYMPPSYYQYYYDVNTNGYKPSLDGDGNHKSYQPDLNLYAEMLVKHLHINNCMAYFVIVNAFGLVDSLGKNFTLRTWNSSSENVIWYPCFYDMDTALGITNSGIESVQPTVYIDYYQNDDDADYNVVKIIRNAEPSVMDIGSTFGAFNLKLWNILRSTNESNAPSDLKSSDKHKGDFYEDVWAKLRDTTINPVTEKSGLLSNVDEVMTRLREQLEGCGEMLFNQDYDVKYLQKYGTTSAIEKLHGNRIENIKKWLTDRWIFLDGIFQHKNLNGKDLAFYKSSVFVMAGGQGKILPLIVKTTSPCLIRAEIGQNDVVYTYFVPSYTDTIIKLPQKLSTDKRLTINATSIITKLEGYKAMGLQYFETVNLPLLNTLNLRDVTSLKGDNPIDFQKQLMYSETFSHIRKIDLSQTYNNNVESFEVNLTNFNKLQEIDISMSNVTSLNLPSAPLAESSLNIVNSKIKMFKLDNQPLISNIDFSGCTQLESIEINNCKNIKRITIPELPELTSITITSCSNLEVFTSSNGSNNSLRKVSIFDCKKINTITIGNGYNIDYEIKIEDTPSLRELSIVTWYGSSLEIKKSDVSGITKLDLTNCYNLKGIKYLEFKDKNENINGIEYRDGIEYYSGSTSEETGYVMDLTPFTNLSVWKLQNCSSMEYLKMTNTLSNPNILNDETINRCKKLKRIFGHYKLTSNVFMDLFNFRLFDSSFTTYPTVGDFHSNNVNGYDTNLSLGVTSLYVAFRETKLTLNEVYYILQKCNNEGNIMSAGTETYYANSGKSVTNLSLCFHGCPNIKCVDNDFKREAFKYCNNVTNIESMFLDTHLDSETYGPILYSPIIENGEIKSGGTMSYLTSLQSCDGLCRTMYIDQDFFRDNVWSGITRINGFSPISIQKAQETGTNKERGYVNSSIFLSNLGNLETIDTSFNSNLQINFEENIAKNNEQQLTYEENLFYHNTKLKSINGSFLNVNCKGDIKNMFGGYSSTKDDKDHFPQQLSAITGSFVMSNVNLYIGDSFFDKIASSFTTCNSGSYGGGEFYPFTCTKYIDDNDVNESGFPYNIVQNCTNIVSLVNLFSGIKRQNNSIYSGKTVSIPSVEMFSKCTSLKNIKRLFYNMQIPLTINGFGFEKCNLTNVQEAFAENQQMIGPIPYGLFYSPSTKNYSTTSGLTQQQALDLNIDVDYGIKNPVYDEKGNLIIEVKYDETQEKNEYGFYPILSGGTYPDGEKHDGMTMNYVDEYGFFYEQTNENNDWEGEIKNIRYENHTTFNGTFDTHKTTITNIGCVFRNCKSSQITPYVYEITSDDIDESYGDMRQFSAASINRKYGKLIEANELYNPIYLIVNKDYDPRLYIQDRYSGEYIVNKKYDPRRYIKNPLWNPYPKKWNKWITDGSSSFIEKISGSTLYDALKNHNVIDLESLNELSGIPFTYMHTDDEKKTFGVDGQGNIQLTNDLKKKLNQRNYMFAPDILRYCDATTTSLNVNSLFQRDSSEYLSNGFYGVLPPFMFETLGNIKSLTNCFNGVNITPYKYGMVETTLIPGSNIITTEYVIGEMFSDKLFSNLNELNDLTGCFSHIHIPSSVKISETLFKNNEKLSILDSLFYDVKWYGLSSGFSTTHISQIDSGLFRGHKEITSVKSMFAYWNGHGQIDSKYRFSKIPSSDFFSRTLHPKLQRISSLFAYASIKVTRKDDCIAFWEWKPIPSEYIDCYKEVDDTTNIIPNAFKGR